MSANLTIKVVEDLDGRMIGTQAKTGIAVAGGNTLKAAWHLDDLTDSSGNGHTLTNNNSVTFVSGKIGNCANFVTASSQYLSLANHADVNPGDVDWTIGFWVNFASSGANMTLFSKMDGATAATYDLLWIPGSNDLRFRVYDDSFSVVGSVTLNTVLSTSTWYCVTCKYDSVNDMVKMRINDGAVASDQSITTGNMTSLGSVPLTIGAKADTGDRNYLNGKIDAFHFWHKALSAGEETAFYNGGTGIEYP